MSRYPHASIPPQGDNIESPTSADDAARELSEVLDAVSVDLIDRLASAARRHNVIISFYVTPYDESDEPVEADHD